ncbi:glucan ABC transporter ATP-binding protein/ permease [Blastochloris viridis]|uniref:Beta-(1-->2)glucan export ATP-binding/permease protein NdvA n=1 Tax=Blastochloris viridis TaxID=1079 RepID=A0A0H5BE82_BLAVI|nr:glucan ABC transporter ATP-binding protein/ permease [Blastochloris viridis]ALK08074.1 Beta-(1-->2)glucan export ATP-binding/permease protein NdvA [Blastochloris viridis]BAR98666.1 beta-(1-->2)glucan export ATP-binding/permease protein NdvA [Blastochloris viridis]CUU43996.1 Beta-(1-->2)glucan export ATP-binding/permease protein NdvA [Blastochloris viridis]
MTLPHLIGRTIGALGPELRLGALLTLANLALACAQFAEPVLYGRIIDTLISAQGAGRTASFNELVPWLLAWAGFALFTVGAGVLVSLHADRMAHRRRLGVMTLYFEHVAQLPLAYHGTTHSGRLMKVMLEGADTLWSIWLAFFRDIFAAVAAVAVMMPVALWMNWRLALLLIGLAVLFSALAAFVMRKTDGMQSVVEEYQSDLAERASDTLGNIALVQSFARVEAEVRGLRDVASNVLRVQIPVLSWWAVVSVATRASTTLTVLAIFLLGVWLHLKGETSIGEIVTFVNFAVMLIARLEQSVSFVNQLTLDAPRLRQFFEVLDTVPAVRDRPGAEPLTAPRGAVAFHNVSFSYDGKRAALADVTFTAEPGETVALVGATGAGKSTALALLHRAYDPQSGRVTVDGIDIRDVTLTSLRHSIGVVFQESLLFNRTIRENLLVGKPDATEAEIRAACEGAQAAEFIDRLTGGLDAIAGERGRALSGGERQRLSIARALLKDPPILILDEATSALDAATEVRVQRALDEVMKGRTTFVIAHRLATVRNADRILVFEGGRIIEAGTFDELVRLGGRFAALAKAQFMVPGEAIDTRAVVET